MRFNKFIENIIKPQKESIISRRFIIAIALIYSSLIIIISISFNIIMNNGSQILRETLMENNRDIIVDKIDVIIDRLRFKYADSPIKIKNEVKKYFKSSKELLYLIIYSKTEDENYFKIIDKIPLNREIKLNIDRNSIVKEKKEINYLKKSLLHYTVEPKIYSQNNNYWQNVYYPYNINYPHSNRKRKLVLQFMVSVSKTLEAVSNYTESIRNIRLFIIIATVILVIAVVVLTLIFTQNFSLLVGNLTSSMKKAANGNLDVSLYLTDDIELNQLALSFNSLIDELKDKTDKSSQETEKIRDIFNTGVTMLKENNPDNAIAIFKTLTIIKPEGFGSFFNLGVAYAKRKDYEDSLVMFENALRINPSYEITRKYIDKVKRLKNL